MSKDNCERRPQIEFQPNAYDIENVAERTKTFLATATSTEKIRRNIDNGLYEGQTLLQVYLSMHEAHVNENPTHVYLQEKTPGRGMKYGTTFNILDAGQIRSSFCSVGDFENISPDDIEDVAHKFFRVLDVIFKQSEYIKKWSHEQKLLLLVIIDQVLTLAHFPRNGSGRVNEDFLCLLAKSIDIPFSISLSGFRGQLDDELEMEVESARWIFREMMRGSDLTRAAYEIIDFLKILSQQIPILSGQSIEHFFLEREVKSDYEAATQAQLESFDKASQQRFVFLPTDQNLRQLIGTTVARLELIVAQPFTPSTMLESKREKIKGYLRWHLSEVDKLLTLIQQSLKELDESSHPEYLPILEILERRYEGLQSSFAQTEQEADQLNNQSSTKPISTLQIPEELKRYIKEQLEAEREAQRIMNEDLEIYLKRNR